MMELAKIEEFDFLFVLENRLDFSQVDKSGEVHLVGAKTIGLHFCLLHISGP
jgi:hypothetical protein